MVGQKAKSSIATLAHARVRVKFDFKKGKINQQLTEKFDVIVALNVVTVLEFPAEQMVCFLSISVLCNHVVKPLCVQIYADSLSKIEGLGCGSPKVYTVETFCHRAAAISFFSIYIYFSFTGSWDTVYNYVM